MNIIKNTVALGVLYYLIAVSYEYGQLSHYNAQHFIEFNPYNTALVFSELLNYSLVLLAIVNIFYMLIENSELSGYRKVRDRLILATLCTGTVHLYLDWKIATMIIYSGAAMFFAYPLVKFILANKDTQLKMEEEMVKKEAKEAGIKWLFSKQIGWIIIGLFSLTSIASLLGTKNITDSVEFAVYENYALIKKYDDRYILSKFEKCPLEQSREIKVHKSNDINFLIKKKADFTCE
jgi:hypothetical protein